MLTVWGRGNSNNVKMVLWCLHELELPHEHVPAGGRFGLVDAPEFEALNPNRLVPVLRDGELVLWESNAIVRYLAAVHSEGLLYPTDPRTRARGDRWMDWCSTTLAPVFRTVFWGLVRTPVEERDHAAIGAAATEVASLLSMVDAELESNRFLAGDEFTMGDFPIFSQSAGGDLVYVAAIPSKGIGSAILVPKDSPIRSLADLKGRPSPSPRARAPTT